MKFIGIIAEYNPFHNGHAYQLSKIREQTKADYIAVAMSGDFVQRGKPAIIDKYARTKMALHSGADFVLELPVLWAVSSAEDFATAGVTLFEKMGCVDGICFGAETDNLPLLSAIAELLVEEPEHYRNLLSSYLKKGMNFPAARAKALCELFTQAPVLTKYALGDSTLEMNAAGQLTAILNSPNNILAIEYLKALKRLHSSMKPILIKRAGAGYHDLQINAPGKDKNPAETEAALPTASATAIRNLILSENALGKDITSVSEPIPGKPVPGKTIPTEMLFAEKLKYTMPDSALHILTDYLKCNPAISTQDFSALLGYQLLLQNQDAFSNIGDITPDIANRLQNNLHQYHSFSQFCELNKSRDVTYSRISRILLHLLLGITKDTYALGRSLDYITYLRILGFRKDSSALFSTLKKSASVPMISKLADASASLSSEAMELLERDIFAANLYEQTKAIKNKKASRSEYAQEIVRV